MENAHEPGRRQGSDRKLSKCLLVELGHAEDPELLFGRLEQLSKYLGTPLVHSNHDEVGLLPLDNVRKVGDLA